MDKKKDKWKKKLAGIIAFAIVILVLLAVKALSFTTYSCTYVYDDFSDNSINTSLWTISDQEGATTAETGEVLKVTTSGSPSTAHVSTVSMKSPGNLTNDTCVRYEGGGTRYGTGNITLKDGAGTTLLEIPNEASFQTFTIELWREDDLAFYSFNKTGNQTRNLYNTSGFTSGGTYLPTIIFYRTNGESDSFNYSTVYRAIDQMTVNVYNEQTNAIITHVNTSVSVSGDNYLSSLTDDDGVHPFDGADGALNILAQGVNEGSDFSDRRYSINKSGVYTLNIYLLNTSDSDVHTVTFTIKEASTNTIVEGADFIVTKVISGTTQTVLSVETDIVGKVQTPLDKTSYYTFNITHPDYLPRLFNLYPTDTTYTILLSENETYEDYTEDLTYILSSVAGNITWDNSTKNITFNYTQASTGVDEMCLQIFNITNGTTPTQLDNTCESAGTNGSMIYEVGDIIVKYHILGYANASGYVFTVDVYELNTFPDIFLFGTEGLFITALIIITLAFIGMVASPVFGVILAAVSLIFAKWLGLLNIGGVAITGIIVLAILVIIVVSKK